MTSRLDACWPGFSLEWSKICGAGILICTGFRSPESIVGVLGRFIRYLEGLLARYNAAVDHREAWKRSKLEPLSKLNGETASELKRRSSDA
jgi:hypothetical protein